MNPRKTEKLITSLDHWFLESPMHSQWIRVARVSFYVRKTDVVIEEKRMSAITLANVNIPPGLQRQGIFTRVVEWAMTRPVEVVVLESVINFEFAKKLQSKDWRPMQDHFPPSFYKRVGQ